MSSRSPGRQKSVMLKTKKYFLGYYYVSITLYHYLLYIIMYWWETWVDWCQVNIIITETKHIFVNIVCMTTQVKRYWKTITNDVSYMGRQESGSKKLTRRRVVKKSNNNYVYLLLCIRISKALYVNKTRGSHCHQIP